MSSSPSNGDAMQGGSTTRDPEAEEEVYLHTEEWPFSGRQGDKEKEALLGQNRQVLDGKKGMPRLNSQSFKQVNLGAGRTIARTLQELDVECATKHLDAITGSVVSHEDLHSFTLMEGEKPVDVVDLAGLTNAPGVFDDVTQQCRMVFTDQNRVVFTQARHSAEVGVPKMRFVFALLTCFHDRWSTRKWTAYYASIKASEIVQVFVQQTLTTSYKETGCNFVDFCSECWCVVGGTMQSEKDINGATQTLGDHDQDKTFEKRWNKTRFMRHALVIRYVDCATNTISQTIALAHPDTPASQIFQMARSIEANITIQSADLMKHKGRPTPLRADAFNNSPPLAPLFKRRSYKSSAVVLFVVGIIYAFAVDSTAGAVMILSVLASLGGSYYDSKAANSVELFGLKKVSPSMVVSQGGAVVAYAISLVVATVAQSSAGIGTGTGLGEVDADLGAA